MLRVNRTGRARAAECPGTRLQVVALAVAVAACSVGGGLAQSPAATATGKATSPSGGTATFLGAPLTAEQVQAAPPTAPATGQPLGSAEPAKETDHCDDDEAPAAAPDRRFHLEASWDNGLHLNSDDKQFHLHVGGNAQIDSTWLIGPTGAFISPGGGVSGVGNASATFLRRARLRFDGDIFDQFDYVVEYDFANANNENSGIQPASFGNIQGAPAPCNIWMQIRDVPVLGNVRFGNQVKPIGMTNNTNQAFLPFMERADNQDAFYAPFDSGFALGISARSWTESERLTWQYGIYRPSIDVFGVSLNKYSAGARVTALPWYEDGGASLVHLGLGAWCGELVQNELRVRDRPELRNAPGYAVPVLVDTGALPGSRQYTLGPEFAMVLGPWTVQAEWTGQFVTDVVAANNLPQGTVFYHGGYLQVLYFLTGEHQEYEKRDGVFGRVVPKENYHLKKNDPYHAFGAWQVGVRFSYLDLNDKGIQGGEVYDWTFGLNWFLTPSMTVQFNYILEHRDAPQGVVQAWISGIGVRGGYTF